MNGELYIARMTPIPVQAAGPLAVKEIRIKDVRVRYAEQTSSTVNVGSAAKTFAVPNIGNVPCGNKPPCSPDGKWKASMGSITMDAGAGEQFNNARVSCIAGPCPFTNIETGAIPRPGRTITVRSAIGPTRLRFWWKPRSLETCPATPFARLIQPSMAAP